MRFPVRGHRRARSARNLFIMSSSRKGGERVALAPVGWTGWDDARAEVIRERILRGAYNTDDVADRVARRLLATGAV